MYLCKRVLKAFRVSRFCLALETLFSNLSSFFSLIFIFYLAFWERVSFYKNTKKYFYFHILFIFFPMFFSLFSNIIIIFFPIFLSFISNQYCSKSQKFFEIWNMISLNFFPGSPNSLQNQYQWHPFSLLGLV